MKKMSPVKGLDFVQVRSNITGRILDQKRVSSSVNQYGLTQVANSMLSKMIQDKRDVYFTVLDAELNVRNEFTIE